MILLNERKGVTKDELYKKVNTDIEAYLLALEMIHLHYTATGVLVKE